MSRAEVIILTPDWMRPAPQKLIFVASDASSHPRVPVDSGPSAQSVQRSAVAGVRLPRDPRRRGDPQKSFPPHRTMCCSQDEVLVPGLQAPSRPQTAHTWDPDLINLGGRSRHPQPPFNHFSTRKNVDPSLHPENSLPPPPSKTLRVRAWHARISPADRPGAWSAAPQWIHEDAAEAQTTLFSSPFSGLEYARLFRNANAPESLQTLPFSLKEGSLQNLARERLLTLYALSCLAPVDAYRPQTSPNSFENGIGCIPTT